EHLLALAGIGEALVLGHHEAAALRARDQELASALLAEDGDQVVLLLEIDEQPHRLAVAAAARQVGGIERVETPVGGEDQAFGRGLRREGESQGIVGLECDAGKVGDVAAQRTDPALLGYYDRDRLALDQRFLDCGDVMLWRLAEVGATLAERCL